MRLNQALPQMRKSYTPLRGFWGAGHIRIGLREPIQLVVSVGNQLVLAVSFVEEIADCIVIVGFDVAGWERRLGGAPKRVIVERGGVVVRILDALEITFGVVGVGRDIIGGIGDGEQPVRVIISIRCGFPILIGH